MPLDSDFWGENLFDDLFDKNGKKNNPDPGPSDDELPEEGRGYADVLHRAYPKGEALPSPPDHNKFVIGKLIHRHQIAFHGLQDNTGNWTWHGRWRMLMASPNIDFTDPLGTFPTPRPPRRDTQDMDSRVIHSPATAAGWLSFVHRKISIIEADIVKDQSHPDDFLPNPGKACSSYWQLHLLGLSDEDIAKLAMQGLPWQDQTKPQHFSVRLIRRAKKGFAEKTACGFVGLGFKDVWRYGVAFQNLDGIPNDIQPYKSRRKAPLTVVGPGNVALARAVAERNYARSVANFLHNLANKHPEYRGI